MDRKLPSDWKNCATCVYWVGASKEVVKCLIEWCYVVGKEEYAPLTSNNFTVRLEDLPDEYEKDPADASYIPFDLSVCNLREIKKALIARGDYE